MTSTVRHIALVISLVALVATVLPSVMFMLDRLSLAQVHFWLLVATIVWYVTAPIWMDRSAA